MAPFSMTLNDP